MFTVIVHKHILHATTYSLLLILLSGCGSQPTYKLAPLEPKTSYDQLTKNTETGEVVVRCTTCSRQYIRELFGKQGDALFGFRSRNRIIPVQISIDNKSDYTWSLSPYDIKLPLADMHTVKARFVKAATKKGLTSLFVGAGCGVLLASCGAAASLLHPMLGAGIFGAGCSLLLTTPIISHNTSAHVGEQNARYTCALDQLTLLEDALIHPGQQISKLVFVQKTDAKDFQLRLCNTIDPEHTMLYQLYLDPHVRKRSYW